MIALLRKSTLRQWQQAAAAAVVEEEAEAAVRCWDIQLCLVLPDLMITLSGTRFSQAA
jgi:hypothetical protein